MVLRLKYRSMWVWIMALLLAGALACGGEDSGDQAQAGGRPGGGMGARGGMRGGRTRAAIPIEARLINVFDALLRELGIDHIRAEAIVLDEKLLFPRALVERCIEWIDGVRGVRRIPDERKHVDNTKAHIQPQQNRKTNECLVLRRISRHGEYDSVDWRSANPCRQEKGE